MIIRSVKTRLFIPPKDDLFSLIKEGFLNIELKEKSVIIITSKVVSIWQGRCILKEKVNDKDQLIIKEADFYIERERIPRKRAILTIKDNLLVPTAGIDESNGKGYFILWPKNSFKAARDIYDFIQKEYGLEEFGVIITDSRCVPSRRGTIGFALGYYGFYPLKDYRKTKDVFGRKYKVSQANLVDSLASSGVLVMGEGDEQTPIVIIEDVSFIDFERPEPSKEDILGIKSDDDFYSPLIKGVKWNKGGGGVNQI